MDQSPIPGVRRRSGLTMITNRVNRLLVLLLAMAMLGIVTISGQQTSVGQAPPAQAPMAEEKAKDVFGDPLPEGAKARMGTVRWRHPAPITFVGFAAKQKHLLTACADGFFRVWDVASGKEI